MDGQRLRLPDALVAAHPYRPLRAAARQHAPDLLAPGLYESVSDVLVCGVEQAGGRRRGLCVIVGKGAEVSIAKQRSDQGWAISLRNSNKVGPSKGALVEALPALAQIFLVHSRELEVPGYDDLFVELFIAATRRLDRHEEFDPVIAVGEVFMRRGKVFEELPQVSGFGREIK